ncbi:cytochrome c oxidase subunit 3 [Buchnera aphidicola]|uniref:cytochrome c oxidase subunit 3 n=1 Tax=Buchnera aphidicola TaxID=9 RepID=UPI0031B862CB
MLNVFKNKKNDFHDIQNHANKINMFGMWIYLMSDCILFATMFTVYFVMSRNFIFCHDFLNLKIVFLETIVLLLSSITYGLASIYAKYKSNTSVLFFILCTLLLGTVFVFLEYYEFYHLRKLGYLPQSNGFLSSFFTLIGLHGAHVVVGLLWMVSIIFQLCKYNVNNFIYTRIMCLGLFWHFLDIIWICIFTTVYLFGKIK